MSHRATNAAPIARLLVLAAPAGTARGAGTDDVPPADTLRIGGASFSPHTLHPLLLLGDPGAQDVPTSALFFDSLVSYGRDLAVEPRLATSWRREGNDLVVALRANVRWHDGKPLVPADVAYTFTRVLGEPRITAPGAECIASYLASAEASPDGVRFRFATPLADDSALALLEMVPIVPSGSADGDLGRLARVYRPVGTGPYRFVRFENDVIEAEANPAYYAGAPRIPRIAYRLYNDRKRVALDLRMGKLDLAARLPAAEFAALRAVPGLRTYISEPPWSQNAVFLNHVQPVFRDERLRRALSHAIDRPMLVERVLRGFGVAAEEAAAPGLWFHHDAARAFPYAPERARELLAEAGWRDTNGNRIVDREGADLRIRLAFDARDPEMEDAARMVQIELRDVGVETDLEPLTHEEVHALAARPLAWHALLVSFSGPLAAAPIQGALAFGTPPPGRRNMNLGGFSDAAADRICREALAEHDRAKARSLWRALREQLSSRQGALQLFRRF